jgi:hypothetical protein
MQFAEWICLRVAGRWGRRAVRRRRSGTGEVEREEGRSTNSSQHRWIRPIGWRVTTGTVARLHNGGPRHLRVGRSPQAGNAVAPEQCGRARTSGRSVLPWADEVPEQQSSRHSRVGDETEATQPDHGEPLVVFGALMLSEIQTILVGEGLSAAAQQKALGLIILVVVMATGRERPLLERISSSQPGEHTSGAVSFLSLIEQGQTDQPRPLRPKSSGRIGGWRSDGSGPRSVSTGFRDA